MGVQDEGERVTDGTMAVEVGRDSEVWAGGEHDSQEFLKLEKGEG